MPSKFPYEHKSYVKDVCIELPTYQFTHRPYSSTLKDNFEFIGREENIQQLLDILLNGGNNGAYLVSGYRGMGKTSFVNKVLADANKKLKKRKGQRLRQVNVSFAKSNMVYNDLLKQFIASLMENVISKTHRALLWVIRPSHILFLATLLYFGFLTSLIPLPGLLGDQSGAVGKEAGNIVTPAVFSVLLSFLMIKLFSLVVYISPSIRIYQRLTKLYLRSGAEISEEENIQSIVKSINFGLFSKSMTKYPPMTSKEIELELVDIINRIDRTSEKPWRGAAWKWLNKMMRRFRYYRENMYVFVFDEMDKIDPGVGGEEYFKEMKEHKSNQHEQAYIDEQRERKQMMVNIISSMKNLITSSRAKFIFIAGREMFEASLADIADRQFSLGSIFHKIIYIDSFLKDKQGNDPDGLSNLIENYMKHLMLPKSFIRSWENSVQGSAISHQPFLFLYNEYLKNNQFVDQAKIDNEHRKKIIISLQQFIIYLTYRSNGSPKKLNRLIEDFIVNGKTLFRENSPLKLIVERRSEKKKKRGDRLYLYLSYNNQFRFGFITFLYRPFLLNYNRRLKNYSDYLLVSTTYLVDHILKFHPVAFSTRNLELLPEVLSSNRNPQLRSFIDDILHFLSYSYIRETEISLFEYKFFNKISNEILHLTNLFEEESAAFNFTLDESYPIKIHIRNKILELRKIHKDYKTEKYEFIHSISALNNLLGDIRFFDQEYNDAITAYSDAIQSLHCLDGPFRTRLDIALLKIQLQLKIGLTFEKIKTYESALASFTEAMNYSQQIIHVHKKTNSEKNNNTTDATGGFNPSEISGNEILQTAMQAYLANLYLIEKISPGGCTIESIRLTIAQLDELFSLIHINDRSPDRTRSMALHHIATLCFYKNTFFQKSPGEHPLPSWPEEFGRQRVPTYLVDRDSLESFKDYRFPNLSLQVSLLSLSELLKCFESMNLVTAPFEDQFKPVERTLFKSFYLIMSDNLNKVSDKSLLTQFATIISRIGDILLTNILVEKKQPAGNQPTVVLQEIIPWEFIEGLSDVTNRESESYKFILKNLDEIQKSIEHGLAGENAYRIRFVLICYLIASKYYSAAAKMAHCGSQLKRVVRVLNTVIKANPSARMNRVDAAKFIEKMEDLILSETLKNASTNANSTDRAQILRYKYYFNINTLHYPIREAKTVYGNLSNNPETRDAILLFAELKLNMINITPGFKENLLDIIPEQDLVNPYNSISFQWTRVLELRLQADINWKLLQEYFLPQFNRIIKKGKHSALAVENNEGIHKIWLDRLYPVYSKLPQQILRQIIDVGMTPREYQEVLKKVGARENTWLVDKENEFLNFFELVREWKNKKVIKQLVQQLLEVICNSVHSLNHTIEILQTYGNNYPAGYAFAGDQYKSLGTWMQLYFLGLELQRVMIEPGKFDMKKEVESLIGIEPLRILEPIALFQTAIHNYRKAIELHHEGNAYKIKIQSLNYLDDDFNDSVDHFACALERQRINSGEIRRRVIKLEAVLNTSQLFKYRSYVNI